MSADPNLQSDVSREAALDAKAQQDKLDALARLSRGMAHDFNNILHVITNASELLRRKVAEGDEEAVRLLDMVKRNARRATRLTRELLAFSGRQTLNLAALNPNRLVADMQDRLREAVGRGISIDTMLGGSLWEVHADPAELETAILNLALNARDAMAGVGKVTIETANITVSDAAAAAEGIGPGEYVEITVRDSGAGMSAETLAKAFDPYFTTKEAGPMIGLGLSRVYGFVRQMHGQIDVDSTPGAGTTVTVRLPRLERAESVEIRPDAQREANVLALKTTPAVRPRGTKSLTGLRVLVVEDESLIGMVAEDLLEQLGCRMVGLVSSLGKALEMAKSTDVDFALLDVDLGGEPVYPVAAALQTRGVPFVFMSGYGGLDGPWRGRPIVQKPFDLDQLRSEIERAVGAG
jgi:nitrogen-specific signal transduction histidine kinase